MFHTDVPQGFEWSSQASSLPNMSKIIISFLKITLLARLATCSLQSRRSSVASPADIVLFLGEKYSEKGGFLGQNGRSCAL